MVCDNVIKIAPVETHQVMLSAPHCPLMEVIWWWPGQAGTIVGGFCYWEAGAEAHLAGSTQPTSANY